MGARPGSTPPQVKRVVLTLWLHPEASPELDATLDWYARRSPRALYTASAILTGTDNTSDGERLLASVAAEPPRPAVRLFLNWAGMLPR